MREMFLAFYSVSVFRTFKSRMFWNSKVICTWRISCLFSVTNVMIYLPPKRWLFLTRKVPDGQPCSLLSDSVRVISPTNHGRAFICSQTNLQRCHHSNSQDGFIFITSNPNPLNPNWLMFCLYSPTVRHLNNCGVHANYLRTLSKMPWSFIGETISLCVACMLHVIQAYCLAISSQSNRNWVTCASPSCHQLLHRL